MRHPFSIIIILLIFLNSCNWNENSSTQIIIPPPPQLDFQKVKNKAQQLFKIAKTKNYSTRYAVLIDFSLHSGVNRFFVWDYQKDTISSAALVSHGCGSASWGTDETKTTPEFSNTPESHKSSLGKYLIKERDYSQWGIHVKYVLHGLDKTNNNALERYIVLHSWKAIKDRPTYPLGTPEGWGCPAVSNSFMTYLDKIFKEEKKHVLMWIYT